MIDYEKAKEYGHYQTRKGNPIRFVEKLRGRESCFLWVELDDGVERAHDYYDGGKYFRNSVAQGEDDIIPIPQVRRVWLYEYEDGAITVLRTPAAKHNKYIHADDAARSLSTDELKAELAKRGES